MRVISQGFSIHLISPGIYILAVVSFRHPDYGWNLKEVDLLYILGGLALHGAFHSRGMIWPVKLLNDCTGVQMAQLRLFLRSLLQWELGLLDFTF